MRNFSTSSQGLVHSALVSCTKQASRRTTCLAFRLIRHSSGVRRTLTTALKLPFDTGRPMYSISIRPFTSKNDPPTPEEEVTNDGIKELFSGSSDDDDKSVKQQEDITCIVEETMRREVAADLFHQYAQVRDGVSSLDVHDIQLLQREIGEDPTENSLRTLFSVADHDNNGVIDLQEFLEHYDFILGGNPARIILVVGGPGSGKGVLSQRLQEECGVVHLSSGDLLRTEVAAGSALGRQVKDIMARGELVSSAIIVALMKRRMRDHPGKRVLLDGFPRSLENAHDLVTLCGKPELALHLVRQKPRDKFFGN